MTPVLIWISLGRPSLQRLLQPPPGRVPPPQLGLSVNDSTKPRFHTYYIRMGPGWFPVQSQSPDTQDSLWRVEYMMRSDKASKFSRRKGPACECLGGSQSELNRKHARWLLTRSKTLMALSTFLYTGCPKKFDLILKAIILKTIQSSSLKFNN